MCICVYVLSSAVVSTWGLLWQHPETFLTVTLAACSWHLVIGDATKHPAGHRDSPLQHRITQPKCQ